MNEDQKDILKKWEDSLKIEKPMKNRQEIQRKKSLEILKKVLSLTKGTQLNLASIIAFHARRAGMTIEARNNVFGVELEYRLIEKALDRSADACSILILERMDQHAYSDARNIILDLSENDWEDLGYSWYQEWIACHSMDAAIICSIADVLSCIPLSEVERKEMAEVIYVTHPNFKNFLNMNLLIMATKE